jgi:hypothetical protein
MGAAVGRALEPTGSSRRRARRTWRFRWSGWSPGLHRFGRRRHGSSAARAIPGRRRMARSARRTRAGRTRQRWWERSWRSVRGAGRGHSSGWSAAGWSGVRRTAARRSGLRRRPRPFRWSEPRPSQRGGTGAAKCRPARRATQPERVPRGVWSPGWTAASLRRPRAAARAGLRSRRRPRPVRLGRSGSGATGSGPWTAAAGAGGSVRRVARPRPPGSPLIPPPPGRPARLG